MSMIKVNVKKIISTLHSLMLDYTRSNTPPYLDHEGNPHSNAIAEERYVTLGGFKQYILLRGMNRNAPILVFLHGGPGTSEMPYFRIYNSELEKDFLVVHWDQRGTCKSYSPELDPETLSLNHFVNDLDELVELLRKEFNKDQVLIVAHSFGTLLGLEYSTRFPDKVASYVAISQISDNPTSEIRGYEWMMSEAIARRDDEAVAALKKVGPPPYTAESLKVRLKYLYKYGGSFRTPLSRWQMYFKALAAPEVSLFDFLPHFKGQELSTKMIWPSFRSIDAKKLYPSLDVPVFFILGRHDQHVPAALSAEYFDSLEAPYKEMIWFENSAHAPPFEEPDKFNQEIIRIAQIVGLLDVTSFSLPEPRSDLMSESEPSLLVAHARNSS